VVRFRVCAITHGDENVVMTGNRKQTAIRPISGELTSLVVTSF
jgi:hypothetical protein